ISRLNGMIINRSLFLRIASISRQDPRFLSFSSISLDSSRPGSSENPIPSSSSTSFSCRPQFLYQPVRPLPQSTSLEYLPKAPYTLRIVSLSYNRPNVHSLLSPNFPTSRCFRYADPAQHFILTAIPPQFAASAPIPSHIRTLSSCFSHSDLERWRARRASQRRSSKLVHELRLTFALRIKDLHKSSVVRKSIRKRWIAALKLILQYGCQLTPAGMDSLRLSASQIPENRDLMELNSKQAEFYQWIVPDYYYIVHPNLSLNTVGLVELVQAIRTGLGSIKQSAMHSARPGMSTPRSPRPSFSQSNLKPFKTKYHQQSGSSPAQSDSGIPSNQHNKPSPWRQVANQDHSATFASYNSSWPVAHRDLKVPQRDLNFKAGSTSKHFQLRKPPKSI
ncbi:hypothetical protein O181_079823, partial [Austropuccinia psidii MF-1]|nr:hypothetical protein [Austropuccinia psidii MF-1]